MSDTLIGVDGQPIPCWQPIPNHWLAVSAYPTFEAAAAHLRSMYPHANRPDLWAAYPTVFGPPPKPDLAGTPA